jgi:hypothetical protein
MGNGPQTPQILIVGAGAMGLGGPAIICSCGSGHRLPGAAREGATDVFSGT